MQPSVDWESGLIACLNYYEWSFYKHGSTENSLTCRFHLV